MRKKASKLTPDIIKAVCECIRLGCPYAIAADCVGVERKTLYNWLKPGIKSPIHKEFRKAFAEAQAQFIRTNLEHIQKAAKSNWPAGAWLMERRFPQYFAKINERTDFDKLRKELKALRDELTQNGSASSKNAPKPKGKTGKDS